MTISCFSPGTTNTTDVVFFDSSFTFSNESIEVGCCDNDMTVTNVTCGKGISCTGQCSAIEASLCPSGNCTGNLEDCGLHQEEEYESTGPAAATGASWEFNWCLPGAVRPIYKTPLPHPVADCQVLHHSACCFHPKCYSKRPKACQWLNYFTGADSNLLLELSGHFQATLAPNLVEFLMATGVAKCKISTFLTAPYWTVTPTHTLVSEDSLKNNPQMSHI